MDFLAEIVKPTGLWAKIIFGLEGGVGNYILAIIIITVLVKLVLVPFDFINRLITKKNTRKQAVLQPALEKIKRQCASNPQMQNQKTMELYKRENYSVVGTCVGMLVYMVLTIVIFITLLGAMNNIAAYKMSQEYDAMRNVYEQTYTLEMAGETAESNPEAHEAATAKAEKAVVETYADIKNGFLWIKSIWRPDSWASSVLSWKDYYSSTRRVMSEPLTDEQLEIEKAEYEKVVTKSFENDTNGQYSKWNGLLILPILSIALTYGSMKVTSLIAKIKAKKRGQQIIAGPEAGKGMQFIMPIMMGVFTLLYNAAFGLYIVAGAVVSFVTSPIINTIVDSIDYKKQLKEEDQRTVSYSRNRRRG